MSFRERLCRWIAIALCVCAPLVASGGVAQAFLFEESTAEFSADIELSGDNAAVAGRIHMVPGRQRVEIDSELLEHPAVIISDEAANKAWLLDPVDKAFREFSLDAMPVQFRRDDWSKMKRTEVGRETVNGLEATKFAIEGVGPGGFDITGHAWVSDRGIVVKFDGMANKYGRPVASRGELRNVRVAPQDPSLFRVPPDYRLEAPTAGLSPDQLDRIRERLREQGYAEAEIDDMLSGVKPASSQ